MISVQPSQNIEWSETAQHWHVTGLPALLELAPATQTYHAGWVLLRGRLLRNSVDYSAKLIAETDQQQYIYDLPITLKGTLLELIELPKGVKRLLLQPMNALGDFTLTELSIMPVNRLQRVVRKWSRVLPLFNKQNRQRRLRSGLRLYTPLIDLKKAYEIAGRFRAYSPVIPYPDWIAEFDRLTQRDDKRIRRVIRSWKHRPQPQVVIHTTEPAAIEFWQQTLSSLSHQLYSAAAITLMPAHPDEAARLMALPGDHEIVLPEQRRNWQQRYEAQPAQDHHWLISIHAGTELSKHALFWLMAEAFSNAARVLIYSDHDYLDADRQRVDPQFKPDWSAELLRSTPYIGETVAIRADRLAQVGGLHFSVNEHIDSHDLLLRVTENLAPTAIHHIAAVLWHQPHNDAHVSYPLYAPELCPVREHLSRLGVAADVQRTNRGHYRIRYGLPVDLPLISIIIPTRDMLGHLQPCVESVLASSSYPNYELLIVDNQSVEPQTLAYFESLADTPCVRVIPYDQAFNYSAINNYAVGQARGEIICLLNNDTLVISPDWMEEMLGHLLQPDVGCVGAKLYFEDGRVQHAGDTVGPGGCADHLHSRLERDAPGYMDRAILAQDLSAVTAACLLTHRDLFLSLGGLDEQNLAVAFNDVDYCLRVREAGNRVVFTPYAELYHHESVSRGKDDSPEKIKRGKREADYMRQRWKHVMQHDPFYNPNLSYSRADFSLSHAPMVNKPW